MKSVKTFIFLFLLAFTLTGAGAGAHKFYVAIFQLDYVPKKQVIQMTSRVFIDDLDNAFEKKYGKKFYIATSREAADLKQHLSKYFSENIHVKINGTHVPLKYLGKETEDDVLVCYFTIAAKEKVKSIEMKNTTLLDTYPEQQNMVHTSVNGNKKSILLTNEKTSGRLDY
jgi:hypothetical protein